MSELKERAVKAAERYLAHRGYEIVESGWRSEGGSTIDLVATEDGDVVFVDVNARQGTDRGLPEDGGAASREHREIAAAAWLAEHGGEEYTDRPIRFDSIAMLVLGESRALLRHHINCLGGDLTAGQTD